MFIDFNYISYRELEKRLKRFICPRVFPESNDCFLQGVYLNDEPQTWVRGSKRTLIDYEQNCQPERINLITIPAEFELDEECLLNSMPEELRPVDRLHE